MGKLNVTILRYLTRDDFRVLTAVNINYLLLYMVKLKLYFFTLFYMQYLSLNLYTMQYCVRLYKYFEILCFDNRFICVIKFFYYF